VVEQSRSIRQTDEGGHIEVPLEHDPVGAVDRMAGQADRLAQVAQHDSAAPVGPVEAVAPFVTVASYQSPRSGQLRVMLVDDNGKDVQPVREIRLEHYPEAFAEKTVLVIDWDVARLPPVVFFRWGLDVTLQDQLLDLSVPVSLDQLAQGISPQAQAWLEPAPMIQSDHPAIVGLASTIRKNASTVQEMVTQTLIEKAKVRTPPPSTAPVDFQNDALSFLQTGLGDCVANANLFAALLRANGVPCRVLTVVARGPEGENMHYIDQYFLPGKGWVLTEPQSTELQVPHSYYLDMGVVHPQMEQHGLGFMQYLGVHQFSMIAQEVGSSGEPRTDPGRMLDISPGLVVANMADDWFRIHGAAY
jgi:hypothetical protein